MIPLVLPRPLRPSEICKELPDSALLTSKSLHLFPSGSTSSVPSQAPCPQGPVEGSELLGSALEPLCLIHASQSGGCSCHLHPGWAHPQCHLQVLGTTWVLPTAHVLLGFSQAYRSGPEDGHHRHPSGTFCPLSPLTPPLPPLDPNSTHPWVLQPTLPQFCLLPSTSVGRREVTMVIIRQDKSNPIISLTEKACNAMGESLSHQRLRQGHV